MVMITKMVTSKNTQIGFTSNKKKMIMTKNIEKVATKNTSR